MRQDDVNVIHMTYYVIWENQRLKNSIFLGNIYHTCILFLSKLKIWQIR